MLQYLQIILVHKNASQFEVLTNIRASYLLSLPCKSFYGHLQRADLERGWAGGDCVVGDGGVAAGQDNVGLATDWGGAVGSGRDGEGEASVNSGGSAGGSQSLIFGIVRESRDLRDEDWASDCDESTVDLRASVRRLDD